MSNTLREAIEAQVKEAFNYGNGIHSDDITDEFREQAYINALQYAQIHVTNSLLDAVIAEVQSMPTDDLIDTRIADGTRVTNYDATLRYLLKSSVIKRLQSAKGGTE